MAQVHPFKSNPNDNNSSDGHPHFEPYSAMFGYGFKSAPWLISQRVTQHWFECQQKFWKEYMEWATWQQQTMRQSMMDSSHWMMHCMQLSGQPEKLHRYLRLNWQKPYLAMSSQAVTSNRMLMHIMIDNWCTWQKVMSQSEHSTH